MRDDLAAALHGGYRASTPPSNRVAELTTATSRPDPRGLLATTAQAIAVGTTSVGAEHFGTLRPPMPLTDRVVRSTANYRVEDERFAYVGWCNHRRGPANAQFDGWFRGGVQSRGKSRHTCAWCKHFGTGELPERASSTTKKTRT